MFVLHNLVVCSFLIFAVAAHAATNESTKPEVQAQPNKVIASENAVELVNINSAGVVALQKVKWVGKKKAQAIVDYRSKSGPFNSLEDLLKVKCRGINKKWLDKVSKFLTV